MDHSTSWILGELDSINVVFVFMGDLYSCPKMLPTSLSLYFQFPSDKSGRTSVVLSIDDGRRNAHLRSARARSLPRLSFPRQGQVHDGGREEGRGAWVTLV